VGRDEAGACSHESFKVASLNTHSCFSLGELSETYFIVGQRCIVQSKGISISK
jgi:hypothetical protein